MFFPECHFASSEATRQFAMAHDAFDAKTGELASICDDPEAVKARASDGALVLVTRVAGYVRSWAIPLAEAEEIVRTGDRPTVPELCGVCLAVRRDNPGECENPFAGYLMAQPHTGLPPAQYMHGHQKKLADVVDLPSVGPITVVRRDLGSFGAPDMQALYALMHEIVDAYSDKGKAADESARALMCVSEFQIYRALRPTGLDTQDVHPPPHLLRPRVRVKGLKSAPALNGRCGYRDSYDDVKRRWHVYLDGKTGLDKPLGIRAENLEIFADKIVACAKSCANAVEDLIVAGRRRCERQGKQWITQEEVSWAAFSGVFPAVPPPQ